MEEDLYTTTDFYTTAVLIEQQYEVKKITKETPGGKLDPKGKVKRFHFENSDKLREVILAYMNRNLTGNLRGFRDAIETVKDMVHSG